MAKTCGHRVRGRREGDATTGCVGCVHYGPSRSHFLFEARLCLPTYKTLNTHAHTIISTDAGEEPVRGQGPSRARKRSVSDKQPAAARWRHLRRMPGDQQQHQHTSISGRRHRGGLGGVGGGCGGMEDMGDPADAFGGQADGRSDGSPLGNNGKNMHSAAAPVMAAGQLLLGRGGSRGGDGGSCSGNGSSSSSSSSSSVACVEGATWRTSWPLSKYPSLFGLLPRRPHHLVGRERTHTCDMETLRPPAPSPSFFTLRLEAGSSNTLHSRAPHLHMQHRPHHALSRATTITRTRTAGCTSGDPKKARGKQGGGRSVKETNAATRLVSRRATAPKCRPTAVQASVFLPVLTVSLEDCLERGIAIHFSAFVLCYSFPPPRSPIVPPYPSTCTQPQCPRRRRRALRLRLHGSHVPLLRKCRRRDQTPNLCLAVGLRPRLRGRQRPAFLPRQPHPHGSRYGAGFCLLYRVHSKPQQRGITTITINEL